MLVKTNVSLIRAVTYAVLGFTATFLLWGWISGAAADNSSRSTETVACTPDGESYRLAVGETPGQGIANAVIELRDVHHLLPAGKGNIDLENIGDAERILLANSGDEDDKMHAGQGIRVCASRLHVQSVNGDAVE